VRFPTFSSVSCCPLTVPAVKPKKQPIKSRKVSGLAVSLESGFTITLTFANYDLLHACAIYHVA
jgi:hypothetical protein